MTVSRFGSPRAEPAVFVNAIGIDSVGDAPLAGDDRPDRSDVPRFRLRTA